jgi:hypothetical protein
VTQVVLPAEVLVRRRDAIAVVGKAWRCFAAGIGARRVARLLHLPMETVRGWLRRLRARVRPRYGADGGSAAHGLGRALADVIAEARQGGSRNETDLWRFVAHRSQGRLLSNTSWP